MYTCVCVCVCADVCTRTFVCLCTTGRAEHVVGYFVQWLHDAKAADINHPDEFTTRFARTRATEASQPTTLSDAVVVQGRACAAAQALSQEGPCLSHQVTSTRQLAQGTSRRVFSYQFQSTSISKRSSQRDPDFNITSVWFPQDKNTSVKGKNLERTHVFSNECSNPQTGDPINAQKCAIRRFVPCVRGAGESFSLHPSLPDSLLSLYIGAPNVKPCRLKLVLVLLLVFGERICQTVLDARSCFPAASSPAWDMPI